MSIRTEIADEKSRQWKLDLDARCSSWLESHPENTAIAPYIPKPFADTNPKLQFPLLPGEHTEKVIVSEILDGVWGVKVGTTLVDAFHGPDARQKALDKGNALADAQRRNI
jgi:hypothetical protein